MNTGKYFEWNSRNALILVLLATAVAFLPCLNADFIVNWDDDAYILNNPFIKEWNWENIKHLFTSLHRGLYKPLTLLTFMAEYTVAGPNPLVFHATNLVLHLLNCALVFAVAARLAPGAITIPFITALLFGIHPMHVESVAWIAERKDVLYSAFFLGSLLAYIKYKEDNSRRNYLVSCALFLCSLLVKPMGITMPFILLLTDWFSGKKLDRAALTDKAFYLVAAAACAVFSVHTTSEAGAIFSFPDYTRFDNALVGFMGIALYTIRLFVPAGLSAIYPLPDKAAGHMPALYYAVPFLVVAFYATLFRLFRHNRPVIFGAAFMLLSILPGLQFIPSAPTVAFDHYSYIAYIGPFLCAAIFLDKLLSQTLAANGDRRNAATAGIAVAFVLLGAASFSRCMVWKNPLTLFNDVLEKYPQAAIGYTARGNTYLLMGDREKAFEDLDKSLSIQDSASARMNRATIYRTMGKPQLALEDLQTVIRKYPEVNGLYVNMGGVYEMLGDKAKALECYNKAIELNPEDFNAYTNRAIMAFERRDFEAAGADYEKAILLSKGYSAAAQYNYGLLLQARGRAEDALARFSRAIELDPAFPSAILARGNICFALGDFACAKDDYGSLLNRGMDMPELRAKRAAAMFNLGDKKGALEAFDELLRRNPSDLDGTFNRGMLKVAMGDNEGAIADFGKTLALKPDSAPAYLNRGNTYLKTGRLKEAVADLAKASALRQNDAKTLNSLGKAKFLAGDAGGALAAYGKAIAADAKYTLAYVNRAEIYAGRKNYAAAKADLDRAIALEPNLQPAREARAYVVSLMDGKGTQGNNVLKSYSFNSSPADSKSTGE